MFPSVFRELLQNSDDAVSTAVEIHFETAAYLDRRDRGEDIPDATTLPDLKSTPVLAFGPSHVHPVLLITFSKVKQWTFKNNGDAFTEQGWTRLRTIGVSIILLFLAFPYIFLHLSAAGNPDPEKIGAFGVGG